MKKEKDAWAVIVKPILQILWCANGSTSLHTHIEENFGGGERAKQPDAGGKAVADRIKAIFQTKDDLYTLWSIPRLLEPNSRYFIGCEFAKYSSGTPDLRKDTLNY
jgi:hypothetical protein